MQMKRMFVYLVVSIALLVAVAACTRNLAPQDQVSSPPPAQEVQASPTSESVMEQLGMFATQTAIAAQVGEITPVAQDGTAQVPPVATQEGLPGATEVLPGEPGAPAETPVPGEGGTPPEQPVVLTPTSVEVVQPTAPVVVVPTATPGIPATYTLQRGEHVYCIARRFDVNPAELLSLNGLAPGTTVFSGLTLRIPQTGNPFPANRSLLPHPTTYTVRSGDTFHSIACLFGSVDPNAIAAANSMAVTDSLTAGQTIQIP
ncbi:MAG TPA: LysM peptidoglycan-binding domain-containing protein [Anaerolineales bacterium]|nr:LysM peptidoglycan-binding domain-containing protein [Anaerolineales bacterium]